MGSEESKPAPPPPPPPKLLTDTPWRSIKGWNKEVRKELKEHVENLGPETDGAIELPYFNILLTGQIKAGKSSYFNSINSLFSNRVISGKADIGNAAQSLTKELRVYKVKKRDQGMPTVTLPWRIIDTMGLDAKTGEIDVRNILKAVDGHVPDKHVFTQGQDFHYESPGFVSNPTLEQQAHCVAVVVDAGQANHMTTNMWSQLRSLRQGLIARNMPTYIILTHIDQACEEVEQHIQNVLSSITIRDTVSKVGKQLMGLPENQIFPVKNYSNEVELEDDMDILLLYALRQMLYSAQGHIENKM